MPRDTGGYHPSRFREETRRHLRIDDGSETVSRDKLRNGARGTRQVRFVSQLITALIVRIYA